MPSPMGKIHKLATSFEAHEKTVSLKSVNDSFYKVFIFLCFLSVEFLWSHTTESMCVGYMSAQDSKAKVRSVPFILFYFILIINLYFEACTY